MTKLATPATIEFATVDMNGVQCSVQSYWSKADNVCILPLGTLAFWTDKSTFGKDEVTRCHRLQRRKIRESILAGGRGVQQGQLRKPRRERSRADGTFANIPGVTIEQNPDIDYENGADPSAQQRIRVPFDITFSSASLSHFPPSGSQTYELDAFIATNGVKAQAHRRFRRI